MAETSDHFPAGMQCVTVGWGLNRYNYPESSLCLYSPMMSASITGVVSLLKRWFVRELLASPPAWVTLYTHVTELRSWIDQTIADN
ncbi:chymotrypsin A-like [Tachysurus ichikawai]